MDVTREAFDDWTIVIYNVGLGALKGRDEFGNVVDFGFVKDPWADFLRWMLVIAFDCFCADLLVDPLACSHYNRLSPARHGT